VRELPAENMWELVGGRGKERKRITFIKTGKCQDLTQEKTGRFH
jgi:hypothetical protein